MHPSKLVRMRSVRSFKGNEKEKVDSLSFQNFLLIFDWGSFYGLEMMLLFVSLSASARLVVIILMTVSIAFPGNINGKLGRLK